MIILHLNFTLLEGKMGAKQKSSPIVLLMDQMKYK